MRVFGYQINNGVREVENKKMSVYEFNKGFSQSYEDQKKKFRKISDDKFEAMEARMTEQTKAQESLDASITKSVEFMMAKLSTEGVFHYLPGDRGEGEQTVSFANVMEDCDTKDNFINALFLLYRNIKQPLSDSKPLTAGELGQKLTVLIYEIDKLALEHATFAAHDEHGLIL